MKSLIPFPTIKKAAHRERLQFDIQDGLV